MKKQFLQGYGYDINWSGRRVCNVHFNALWLASQGSLPRGQYQFTEIKNWIISSPSYHFFISVHENANNNFCGGFYAR